MLIRLVKMEFEPEKVNIFLKVFAASRTKILGMEGCMGLELLNGIDQKNIFLHTANGNQPSVWKSIVNPNCSKIPGRKQSLCSGTRQRHGV